MTWKMGRFTSSKSDLEIVGDNTNNGVDDNTNNACEQAGVNCHKTDTF